MKKILTIIFCFVCSVVYAQKYYVHSVMELQNDLTARRKAVKDTVGRECALVRLCIPSVNDVTFESAIVGEPETLPGEYSVFIPGNSTEMALSIGGERYDVIFPQFNIIIENKKCYRVVFTPKTSTSMQISKTTISANYDNAIVLIDGVPVGQTPLQIDNIPLGKHVVSVPNTFGVTMREKIIDFTSDNRINLTLHKEKRENVVIDWIPTPDGPGVMEFGTNLKVKMGKEGIVDYVGDTIVPFEFDDVMPIKQENGCYCVEKDGKMGAYNPEKGLIVPCIYDFLYVESNGYFVIRKEKDENGKRLSLEDVIYGVLSPEGKLVVPMKFRYIEFGDEAIIVRDMEPVTKKTIFGAYSYEGKEIIKAKYSYLSEFSKGYAKFYKNDGKRGIVDVDGNEKYVPENYKFARYFSVGHGLFNVKDQTSGKWGWMNTQLELVIPTIYDEGPDYCGTFYGELASNCKIDGVSVIIDLHGNVIVDCKDEYDKVGICSEEDGSLYKEFIHVVNSKKKEGILDTKGNVVIPCKYKKIKRFVIDNGVMYFQCYNDDDEIIICDEQNKEVFRLPSNLEIREISDGFIMVEDEESGSYGYINAKGELLANCIYRFSVESEKENFNENRETCEEEFDMSDLIKDYPISEGLAVLNIGDRFGFIDNKGNVKVPMIYTAVTPFKNGVSYVRLHNGKWKKIYKSEL